MSSKIIPSYVKWVSDCYTFFCSLWMITSITPRFPLARERHLGVGVVHELPLLSRTGDKTILTASREFIYNMIEHMFLTEGRKWLAVYCISTSMPSLSQWSRCSILPCGASLWWSVATPGAAVWSPAPPMKHGPTG